MVLPALLPLSLSPLTARDGPRVLCRTYVSPADVAPRLPRLIWETSSNRVYTVLYFARAPRAVFGQKAEEEAAKESRRAQTSIYEAPRNKTRARVTSATNEFGFRNSGAPELEKLRLALQLNFSLPLSLSLFFIRLSFLLVKRIGKIQVRRKNGGSMNRRESRAMKNRFCAQFVRIKRNPLERETT